MRLPGRAVRIAQARGEYAPLAAGAIDLQHGGAILLGLDAVLADIAVGADGRIELGAVGAGGEVLGPVVIDGAGRQVGELHARCA